MGVVSTALVYVLGKLFFSKQVGLVSALFYATSPLIVVNARIPYHTAPIPFFSCLFFLLLLYLIKNMHRKWIYFFTFFTMGILFQLELSNAVVLFVVFLCFKFFKIKLTKTRFFLALSGLVIGIIPFILYDLTHQFKQTIGFPLWIINRFRLFLGLTLSTNATTGEIPGALSIVFAQISRTIFPAFLPITIFLIVGILLTVIMQRKMLFTRQNRGFVIVFLWLSVPLFSFLVHAAPGTAYFPLIFPPIALLVGYCFSLFTKKSLRIGILVLVVLACFYNGYYTITNQFFLDTGTFYGSAARGWNYGFGPAFSEQEKIAQFIVKDASGQKFSLIGGGSMTRFSSSIDNYKYLVWWMGGKLNTYAKLDYTLYPPGEKNVGKAYYSNEFIFIKKN
jgi:4-amino-4-deoxy-L-arabinose transferase-like glycosyltransferase